MEKLVRVYGTYHKPVKFRKYSDPNTIDVKVSFYDLGGNRAKVCVTFWNGRTWNNVARCSLSKEEANEIAKIIIQTNEINKKDLV